MPIRILLVTGMTILLMSCSDNETDHLPTPTPQPKITSIQQCDRSYSETKRTVPQIQSESTYLEYDNASGQVKIVRGNFKTSTADVTYSMDKDRFYEMCSPAANKIGAAACPYYIECISQVKQHNDNRTGKLSYFDFEDAAIFLRAEAIKHGEIEPSIVEPHRYASKEKPTTVIKNVDNACDTVIRTYKPAVVAASIFKNIPEVPSFDVANELGGDAVDGVGTCNCVLADYLGFNINMSIGTCRGPEFVSY